MKRLRSRPALRVAVLGMTAAVLGYTLFAVWLGVHASAYGSARDRATATAVGRVIEDGIGTEDDIRVRWTDSAGLQHVQRFGVYDTDRYTKGGRFDVAYDPGQADPQGFPADPDETGAEDDLQVPIMLAGVAVAFYLGLWARRGQRFRRVGRLPGRPMTAVVLSGAGRIHAAPGSTFLALSEVDPAGPVIRCQRVMWHPALDQVSGPVPVTVHGNPRKRRAVVAELPDGSRPVPFGVRRRRVPQRLMLDERSTIRADLRDAFILLGRGRAAARRRPVLVAAGRGDGRGGRGDRNPDDLLGGRRHPRCGRRLHPRRGDGVRQPVDAERAGAVTSAESSPSGD